VSGTVTRGNPGDLGLSEATIDSRVVSVSAEAFYDIPLPTGAVFGPLGIVDAAWVQQGEFSETGSDMMLTNGGEVYQVAISGLGLRLSGSSELDTGLELTGETRLLWRHQFGEVPTATNGFVGDSAPNVSES
jgi:outer membrane autotransporter protein